MALAAFAVNAEAKRGTKTGPGYAEVQKLLTVPARKPRYIERLNIEKYLLKGEGEPRWTNGEIPTILSETDVSRYRVIFRVQEDGDWRLADQIIRSLENPILMGHVLWQLMSP